ncbi:MAG: phosphomethylpyrimidine synthase ThiC [Proteobacteria bacterium]|nr:phosphomethylpyrimidine synthase ThiC [Pseudomonadota bacterium]
MDKKDVSYLKKIAKIEEISYENLIQGINEGKIVFFKNKKRDTKPMAVGKDLTVKINANIGTSMKCNDISLELKKVKVCEEAGADAIMDLSTGGDIDKIRKEILNTTNLPLGTVPIYEVAYDIMVKKKKGIEKLDFSHFIEVMEKQAEQGVDFMTIHCGITLNSLKRLERSKRVMGVVSRGGALLVEWMKKNKKENPLYENFQEILKVAKKFNIVISLGDGLRPGSTLDATDGPQIEELITLGELVIECRKAGVQVIVEGPGHVPINQIETNIKLQKALCHESPFYVLGPLATDIGAGYDHIVSAIGGAWAAYFGADFLCYVTPAEHLHLPNIEDVRMGVIASKIAAHCADLARGKKRAWELERRMSESRFKLNWEGQIQNALDSYSVKKIVEREKQRKEEPCSMCGDLCSIKTSERSLKKVK